MRSEPSSEAERPGAAVLLSGGASERFGGRPKGLLDVAGEPALRRMARICRESKFDPVVVVAGPHFPEIRRALEGDGSLVIPHDGWWRGRTGSVKAGLAELEAADPVLLWPVDCPFVEAKTLGVLLRSMSLGALALWSVPTFEGQGGHPVLVRGPALSAIRDAPDDRPLRAVEADFGPQIVRVAVDDEGVVAAVKTWAEYDAFRERLPTGGR